MRAIDRMYFDKYAVDPEGDDFIFDASAESWNDESDGNELEQRELYDGEWLEME